MNLPEKDNNPSDLDAEHALDEEQPESKSQRKRNARQVTILAGKLVSMTPKKLSSLPLQAPIVEAIKHCAEIRSHGARKRQLHYVSKLLRESGDLDQLQMLIDHPEKSQKKVPVPNPHIDLRDRLLLNLADHVDELRTNYPSVSVQQVRQMVRKAHNQTSTTRNKSEAKESLADEPAEKKPTEGKPEENNVIPPESPQITILEKTQAAQSLLQLLSKSA